MTDGEKTFAAMALIIVVLVAGVTIGFCLCGSSWQTECVKRGHAEYNATTGAWQWKELAKEPSK
jgi:hypothetical protein